MRSIRRTVSIAAIFLLAACAVAQETKLVAPITPAGQRLVHALDKMDVEHRWLSGKSVKWRTGEALDQPVTDGKSHTHCSAFAAAAAAELGVYLLRPPKHPSAMLANAQYDWLGSEEGRKEGWTPVATGLEAQQLANRGTLVVAVYKESDPKKHGHIAIVRPSAKTDAAIQQEGPQIIQAGMNNYTSASLKEGFKHHRGAFRDGQIRFFSHVVPDKRKAEGRR